MQDKIIKYLESCQKAQTIIEINDYLGLKTAKDLEQLQTEVNQLITKGIIYETRKQKYLLLKNCSSLKVGKIDVTKNGYAFLIQDNNDIFISEDNLNGAIENDICLVDIFIRNKKQEGKVIRILERKSNNFVGEILFKNNIPTVILDDKKLNIEVILEKDDYPNLVNGHKVLIELGNHLDSNKFRGHIIKVIGHINDPRIDILSIAYAHNIEIDFDEQIKEELKKLPSSVSEEEYKGRVNLTNELCFTIDGEDAKDLDDAISIQKENDNYILKVHIADVTHYVKKGSILYKEAFKRGTSHYLADTVIAMYPHELSNGICSLNENAIRLAITVTINYSNKGDIISYDIKPTVIKSNKRMTYKAVNSILVNNNIPKGYEDYVNSLLLMQELANLLRKNKIKNGYLDFNIPEAKIIQDQNGKCIDIVKQEENIGENIIEDFMVAANEVVAKHLCNLTLPFIYRIHEIPKEEKINDFLNLLEYLNIKIPFKNNNVSNKMFQKLLKCFNNRDDKSILASLLLQSMPKAIYSTDNIGHFGLALKNYTHFTAPIRRFPDTIVHELIKTYLFKKDSSLKTIKYYQNYLKEVAQHSTETEQNSVDAERDVLDMKMAEYMESKVGNKYTGMITNVTKYGFYVILPNLVEGFVSLKSLKGNFKYFKEKGLLMGRNKSYKYQIGTYVDIIVVRVDKDVPIIDFEVDYGISK